jgi:hypothetical protein
MLLVGSWLMLLAGSWMMLTAGSWRLVGRWTAGKSAVTLSCWILKKGIMNLLNYEYYYNSYIIFNCMAPSLQPLHLGYRFFLKLKIHIQTQKL